MSLLYFIRLWAFNVRDTGFFPKNSVSLTFPDIKNDRLNRLSFDVIVFERLDSCSVQYYLFDDRCLVAVWYECERRNRLCDDKVGFLAD